MFGPEDTAGVLGTWTILTVTSVRACVSIIGLTPGTNHTFEVRALGKLGFTDWSDPVSQMSIYTGAVNGGLSSS